MTYVAADKYLRKGGRVGFVLPKTIFQSETGGWHFRRLELPNKSKLCVEAIQDIDALKPFRGQATNTSCIAIFKHGAPTRFPIDWLQWRPMKPRQPSAATISDVRKASKIRKLRAEPISAEQDQSPWIVGSKATLALLRDALGRSDYANVVREGLNTRGANGVYFVTTSELAGRLMVTNLAREGRNRLVNEETLPIEADYLYPLLRGQDVSPFKAVSKEYIIVPHSAADPVSPVAYTKLPKLTQKFFAEFKPILGARKKFRNFEPSVGDWHGLYSVLSATFSMYKVVWREMASGSGVIAAAVSSSTLPTGDLKIVMPDHKLAIIPCESESEADYLAAFLNSDVANLIVRSYAVATGISTHILERIAIPRHSSREDAHNQLAMLGKKARCDTLSKSEKTDMSVIAARILGLSEAEARSVVKELSRI